jgi:hypothetical protein
MPAQEWPRMESARIEFGRRVVGGSPAVSGLNSWRSALPRTRPYWNRRDNVVGLESSVLLAQLSRPYFTADATTLASTY